MNTLNAARINSDSNFAGAAITELLLNHRGCIQSESKNEHSSGGDVTCKNYIRVERQPLCLV